MAFQIKSNATFPLEKPKKRKSEKKSEYKKKSKTKKKVNQREGMSKSHAANMVMLPCAVAGCNKDPCGTGHHLKRGIDPKGQSIHLQRGMGMRTPDWVLIPLCWLNHHSPLEELGSDEEERQLAEWGIDPSRLANALWEARDSLEDMREIVLKSKRGEKY